MIEPRKEGEWVDEKGLLRNAEGDVLGDHIELDDEPLSDEEQALYRRLREKRLASSRLDSNAR